MANGTAAKAPASKTNNGGGFAGLIKGIQNSRLGRFLKESWIETFQKCTWPSRQELQAFTLVVLFALLVVAFYIGVLDGLLTRITQRLSSAG